MFKSKTQLIFALFFLFSVLSETDSLCAAELTGRVYDQKTGQGLPYANISLVNTQRGAAADKHGNYTFTIAPGSYVLQISMMGYQTSEQALSVQSGNVIELNIALMPTTYLMQGVTIIQPKITEQEKSVSNLSVESKKIVNMPGSFGDIYRSVKTLPGVSSNNGMSSEFNVRGGMVDENLVIVNGAQVYRPFHVKEAPNASVAIFNMDLLKKVDLITGGFTARYGDKMSSIMNIEYREGNPDRFSAQVDGNMMEVGLVAEGPIPGGSFLIGVRKSYLQYILDVLGEDDVLKIGFYDIQGQFANTLSPGKKLAFQFIHSGDNYSDGPNLNSEHYHDLYYGLDVYTTQSHFRDNRALYHNNLFAFSYTHTFNSQCFMKTIASYYDELDNEDEFDNYNWEQYLYHPQYKRSFYYYNNYKETQNRDLVVKTSEIKHDVNFKITPFHEIVTGFSYKDIRYKYTNNWDVYNAWGNNERSLADTTQELYIDSDSQHIKPVSYKVDGYVEDNWQIVNNLFANVGIRMDYFRFNRDLDISPRINMSYITNWGPIFRAAWGYYYQSPSYKEFKYAYESSDNTQAQRAIHHIISVEYPLYSNVTLKLEAYDKEYDRLIAYENRNGRLNNSRTNDSKGYARGLDFFISGNWNRVSGWISYGFLDAKEDSLGNIAGYIPRISDQRHTLSIVADINIGHQWMLRLKGLYGSGYPYTPSQFVQTTDDEWQQIYGQRNSGRLPSYQRIDVRIARSFTLKRLTLETYLEVINLLDRENVFAYEWDYNDDRWERVVVKLFPRIPNFGMSIGF